MNLAILLNHRLNLSINIMNLHNLLNQIISIIYHLHSNHLNNLNNLNQLISIMKLVNLLNHSNNITNLHKHLNQNSMSIMKLVNLLNLSINIMNLLKHTNLNPLNNNIQKITIYHNYHIPLNNHSMSIMNLLLLKHHHYLKYQNNWISIIYHHSNNQNSITILINLTNLLNNHSINLEQIECDDRIIYQHTHGTPYCSLLSHSKKTNVFVMTNSDGFTLVRKTKGEWKKNDYKIPENIILFTQDFLGNEIIITGDQYSIHFTSLGSFKYVLLPGVKCCKIVVDGLMVWEKTDDDVGFPTIIYLSEQLTVTIKFEKYSKTFRKRPKYYKLLHIKKTSGKDRYS
ncbi:SVSP family protein [Theileria parva strain Muguga]|uniref:Uncharacterized protein n=1 Tax=Theileria parva TaxID=5875 RepID=Q4MYG3_THEPA|nr:SVSP family protein [Theileria parva strain Muguga]EAN30719.1 SVSP family protein [Theileria parva strain Muguga]|eukprot:XP_763002.1 hypothetical protein [Theileria parva strain Muguga]